jgi:hypothetical protein
MTLYLLNVMMMNNPYLSPHLLQYYDGTMMRMRTSKGGEGFGGEGKWKENGQRAREKE